MSNSFAVIETLGRQYKVSVGDVIKVDRIAENKKDVDPGTKITFTNVLLIGTHDGAEAKIGTPVVQGASVAGTILEQGKDKKGISFKKKRRKGYTRKKGFRRAFTVVQIDSIAA